MSDKTFEKLILIRANDVNKLGWILRSFVPI